MSCLSPLFPWLQELYQQYKHSSVDLNTVVCKCPVCIQYLNITCYLWGSPITEQCSMNSVDM